MTLVVVDGMDRAGKDTLIRSLVKSKRSHSPLHILHNVAPPTAFSGDEVRRYHLDLYMRQFKMMAGRRCIVNRSFMSEWVYGHAYRQQDRTLPDHFWSWAEEFFSIVPHIMVTLVGDVYDRDDGDSTFKSRDHMQRELLLFTTAHMELQRRGFDAVCFDNEHPDQVAPQVLKMLGEDW